VRKYLFLLALASLGLIFLFNSGGEKGVRKQVVAGSYLEDVEVVSKEAGEVQWKLLAVWTTISDDGNVASMKGVTVDLPSQGMVVKAGSGSYDLRSSDLTLSGGVKAGNRDFEMFTEKLELLSERGELVTEDPVTVQGSGFEVTGRGLRAYGEKFWLLSDVRAEFH